LSNFIASQRNSIASKMLGMLEIITITMLNPKPNSCIDEGEKDVMDIAMVNKTDHNNIKKKEIRKNPALHVRIL
jgi:hypothetical protein